MRMLCVECMRRATRLAKELHAGKRRPAQNCLSLRSTRGQSQISTPLFRCLRVATGEYICWSPFCPTRLRNAWSSAVVREPVSDQFSVEEKQSFLCWGQLASGDLPLSHTHGRTHTHTHTHTHTQKHNCNFSTMTRIHTNKWRLKWVMSWPRRWDEMPHTFVYFSGWA